jgi:hypothetical protein
MKQFSSNLSYHYKDLDLSLEYYPVIGENPIHKNCEISFEFQYSELISVQSKKVKIDSLKQKIQNEFKKFDWIIIGEVNLKIVFYISEYEKIYTDKIADLDNLINPIIEPLQGKDGLIIDECQIKKINIYWISKNESTEYNIIHPIVFYIYFDIQNVLKKDNKNIFLEFEKGLVTSFSDDIDEEDIRSLILFKQNTPYSYYTEKFTSNKTFNLSKIKDFKNQTIRYTKLIEKNLIK